MAETTRLELATSGVTGRESISAKAFIENYLQKHMSAASPLVSPSSRHSDFGNHRLSVCHFGTKTPPVDPVANVVSEVLRAMPPEQRAALAAALLGEDEKKSSGA